MVVASELLPNASQATPCAAAAVLSLAWNALDLRPCLRQRRQTTSYICKQSEADLVQQSLKTQHCCSFAASAYLLDWAAT